MTSAAELRAQLDHPVVDCDGHWVEPISIFLDFLRDTTDAVTVDRYVDDARRYQQNWYGATVERRAAARLARPPWWTHPTNSLDRATVTLPGLLAERLDEFGLDVALVYPSLGLSLFRQPDAELRVAGTRALNTMVAELFGPFRDRLIPVATIPMESPDEAVDELTFAVRELDFRAAVVSGHSARTSTVEPGRTYIDTVGLDSVHDYDRFWKTCIELGVAVTDHGGSMVDSNRRCSPTNFVYNHVGHFAEAMAAKAKAIFLGGVTRRFPELPFAFLEGGVGFACNLLFDLESHFEKRNPASMDANLRPTNIEPDTFRALVDKYGTEPFQGRVEDMLGSMEFGSPLVSLAELSTREVQAVDDFASLGVTSAKELRASFTRNFYFGCEPDDLMTTLAFDTRLQTGLKPVFGSDIGHFDVPVLSEVLTEAWELVEDGFITERDFQSFTFDNAVALHTSLNPDFFAGTRIADQIRAIV